MLRLYLNIALLLLTAILARAADGECRLIYAGNLARGDAGQVGEIHKRLLALRARSQQDGVPALLLLPGNVFDDGKQGKDGNARAAHEIRTLKPDVWALGPNELQAICSNTARVGTFAPGIGFPLISLNGPRDSKVIVSSRILSAGPLRLGIAALTLSVGQLPDKALRARVAREVRRLHRRHCDLVLLLGPFDAKQGPLIAALFPGIDLVLGSSRDTTPQAYGPTVLAPISADTPYYGELELAVRDGRLAAWRGGMMAVSEQQ